MSEETNEEFLKPIKEWADTLTKSYNDDGSKAGYFLCKGDWLRLLALATRGAKIPDEATPNMLAAAWQTVRRIQPMGRVFCSPGPAFAEAYRAMLSAALGKDTQ